MRRSITKSLQLGAAAAVLIVGLFASDRAFVERSIFVTQANAIIGRPLTPMSYAGVARRTTRRAVAAGAYTYGAVAAGAAVGAAVVAAPVAACVQTVDVYGRIYMSCP
jgi:hypothetical protein